MQQILAMSAQGYMLWKAILFESTSIMMHPVMQFIPILISIVWAGVQPVALETFPLLVEVVVLPFIHEMI